MEPKWEAVDDSNPNSPCLYRDSEYDREELVLPRSVRKWAELDMSDGCVNIPSRSHYLNRDEPKTKNSAPTLAEMNDRGATFDEIADIIEKEL